MFRPVVLLSATLALAAAGCASPVVSRAPGAGPRSSAAAPATSLGQVAAGSLSGRVTVPAGIIAAGGGNIVAAGGGNLVAAEGAKIVAGGGGNIIAAGGGNIIAAGGGNIVAAGGGNIVAGGGGHYRLQDVTVTSEDAIGFTHVPVYLADTSGRPIPGLPPVTTDATGHYRFPRLPTVAVVVVAELPMASGRTAKLSLLAEPTASGVVADITPVTTLVTTRAVKGLSGVGHLDAEKYQRIVEAMAKIVKAAELPDLSQTDAVTAAMDVAAPKAGVVSEMTGMAAGLAQDPVSGQAMAGIVEQMLGQPQVGASGGPVPAASGPQLTYVALDGLPGGATVRIPSALAVDPSSGELLIAERKLGLVLGVQPASGQLRVVMSGLNNPTGLAVKGDLLYVADPGKHTMWVGHLSDVSSPAARLDFTAGTGGGAEPQDVALLPSGALVFFDRSAGTVYQARPGEGAAATGTPAEVLFGGTPDEPREHIAMAADADGAIWMTDDLNNRVQRRQGEATTAVETADALGFNRPIGVAVAPGGEVYVADAGNRMIRRFMPGSKASRVFPTTEAACSDNPEPGTEVPLTALGPIALSPDGKTLYGINGRRVFTLPLDGLATVSASPQPVTAATEATTAP